MDREVTKGEKDGKKDESTTYGKGNCASRTLAVASFGLGIYALRICGTFFTGEVVLWCLAFEQQPAHRFE